MLSTVLELAGYVACVAAGVLVGVLIAGLVGAVAGGLVVLGPVLVVLGLAAERPKR